MMKDLLVEESPDLFFLLNHYKNSNINIDKVKKLTKVLKTIFDEKKLFVRKYFKLHDMASNIAICLCKHNETKWDIPGKE